MSHCYNPALVALKDEQARLSYLIPVCTHLLLYPMSSAPKRAAPSDAADLPQKERNKHLKVGNQQQREQHNEQQQKNGFISGVVMSLQCIEVSCKKPWCCVLWAQYLGSEMASQLATVVGRSRHPCFRLCVSRCVGNPESSSVIALSRLHELLGVVCTSWYLRHQMFGENPRMS